ncbi:hypothetical protein EW146_g685 [Bondarzewia mesenterica]|uniref:Uncharacterized protein n=1 Tax=Bondarzewia mesenterica TaxID=1095465 RepID=A0A4S4M830_9AGAM|nr:hypothetical protein EW146_g685 [Bondarzewia mesenterica]
MVPSASAKNITLDDLFLERLDAVTEKTLSDMKAFAHRESCSLDIVRRHVVQWHSKYLFASESALTQTDRRERIKSVLVSTSQTLEALHQAAGLHSFFLVVDPEDPSDNGFLGGTRLGREFWRGLRGGGESGTNAFKAKAMSVHSSTGLSESESLSASGPSGSKKVSAHQLKADVYAAFRMALRNTSGLRTADMKWTNHGNLKTSGVRMVGWPQDIPMRNPSTLSMAQNKLLKDSLELGTLRFERLDEPCDRIAIPSSISPMLGSRNGDLGDSVDLSWALAENVSVPPSIEDGANVHGSPLPRVFDHGPTPAHPSSSKPPDISSFEPTSLPTSSFMSSLGSDDLREGARPPGAGVESTYKKRRRDLNPDVGG